MLDGTPGWELKIRFWIENPHGRVVLGPGRIELMELIDQHHSISAAARKMGMSYRRAWALVQDLNEAAGETLIQVSTGGVGGGGAAVTPRGQEAIQLYRRLALQLSTVTATPAEK